MIGPVSIVPLDTPNGPAPNAANPSDARPSAAGHALLSTGRRRFLGGSAALVIGVTLPIGARGQSASASGAAAAIRGDAAAGGVAPNAFVRIAEDDTVTVIVKHTEMGQGPFTGLATLVAEELDADWSQMRAESAPANAELYANSLFGIQGTGGSTAMANSYEQMRRAGAGARAVLIGAAAEAWDVNAGDITIENGVLSHPDGHTGRFGEFAAAAAGRELPAEPSLKAPAEFRLIGTTLPKLDTDAKSTGRATFTLDAYPDGVEVAVVAHPPRFGATVASFDDASARKIAGVLDVQTVPQGVAVYAATTWAALKGRDALVIEWDDSAAETRSTDTLMQAWRERATGAPGIEVEARGDVDADLPAGAESLERVYEFPYLAHAPMEPLDGVIRLDADGAEVWMGSQLQTVDHGTLAGVLGLEQANVQVHTMFAGGSFGRRAQAGGDFAAELAAVARARRDAGGDGAPIKLMWTREDDIRGGRYRPLTVHAMRGAVGPDGDIVRWQNTIATQSILSGTPFEQMVANGVDPTSHEGSSGLPYALDNLHVSLHSMDAGVPVLWWRSVGHTHTAFATETFLDELLSAAGKDPYEGRLALLDPDSRDAGVLRAVAELADWGSPVPEGRARGIALHKSFGSYVAQVTEVSAGENGLPRVHKVWCAVDCGIAVNPNVVTAQIEGGVGFALGAILHDEITLGDDGRVEQSNFHDYPSLRIDEMPAVEVAIVPSAEPPSGIGEPGVPPLAPAVANAWRALTGVPTTRLPFAGSPA